MNRDTNGNEATNENPWKLTQNVVPENGEVVEAMDSGGHVQQLKRGGNLWWFPDGSMYVYYTPKAWRKLA